MASSRRPRSSTNSLAPRALRTFRALSRIRGAFPLSRVTRVGGSTFRIVLIGSLDATPASLRAAIGVRTEQLRSRMKDRCAIENIAVSLLPGVSSLGRRVFSSRSFRNRRSLLEGGSALLQVTRPRPIDGLKDRELAALLKEACHPLPGFVPTAYVLSLPSNVAGTGGPVAVTAHRFIPVLPAVVGGVEPRVAVLSALMSHRHSALQVPLTLSSRVAAPLIQNVSAVARATRRPRPLPAFFVLGAIAALVKVRSLGTETGQSRQLTRWSKGWAAGLQILATAVRVRLGSGGIAQLVERVLCKHPAIGSIPIASTIFLLC